MMEEKKKNWEKPLISHIDSLPAALGHCKAGSTEGQNWCAYGDDTFAQSHTCTSGGVTGGGCTTGTTPT